MAVNDSLKQDINRLVNPGGLDYRTKRLPERTEGVTFGPKRASAKPAKVVASLTESPKPTKVRREVKTTYSHLIITADGAFEMPLGWPGNGDYPTGTPIPSPLPDSLKVVGALLKLDTGVQYYEQRRVHSIFFEEITTTTDNNGVDTETKVLVEEQYLVDMAVPFFGYGYYQGTAAYTTSWQPLLEELISPLATLL